ncbi:M23 family metallopeptidase [Bacillus alkalicellulosilyticus]|uniref:M23 family metallopeptidase n=1 Tax=Alkalihalobacterium alkalicellulosilyticum TaxID=1912214 RepID=UPI0009973B56|nr:M23 family metallopeptidase [Bacillus alkalicellulosilyticus]
MKFIKLHTLLAKTRQLLTHKTKEIYQSIQPFAKPMVASAITASVLFVAPMAKAEEVRASLDTIFHVYVDGEYVGIVDGQETIDKVVEKKLSTYQEKYNDLKLVIGEKIDVIPELVFHMNEGYDETVTKIDELLTVKAEAVTIKIDEEPFLYVSEEESANTILDSLILEHVKEKEFEEFNSSTEEERTKKPKTDDKIIRDIRFTNEMSIEGVIVNPEDVVSKKDAVKLLQLGTLEQYTYKVKSGDVLGSIASKHDLSVSELLELNDELKEDTVLQIDQEINVTSYEPAVKVIVEEAFTKEEEIPYQTETKEDSSMWKGETKIEQEGKVGKRIVSYEVVKENGKTLKREVSSEEVVEEPQSKIIIKGTKEQPSRGSGQLGWPAVGGYISSYQGTRWGRFHRGIDIARPSNYNILAADNGTVKSAGWQGGYGNTIVIDHNNGIETMYAHLESMSVSAGQTVSKGQVIGVMGQTGNSTGIHLHFEVYQNGQLQNPMDYLR